MIFTYLYSKICIAQSVSHRHLVLHHKQIASTNRMESCGIVRNVHSLSLHSRILTGSFRPKMVFQFSHIPDSLLVLDKSKPGIKAHILTESLRLPPFSDTIS